MTDAPFPSRRWLGPALVAAGLGAFAMSDTRMDAVDLPASLFVALAGAGAWVWLHRWTSTRWLAASVPFWMFGNASGAIMFGAVGLTMAWLVSAALMPVLPGRRRRFEGAPLPQLAHGPLGPVEARTFSGGQPSRALTILSWVLAGLALVLAASSAVGADPAISGGLSLACLIIAATFAFGNWFAVRVRLRVDQDGLHSRVLFREHTVRWPEVADLYVRYVYLGMGGGVRLVYYCVTSPTREFAFPSSLVGASDLKHAIEQATGLTFPAPEIEPTL